MRVFRPVPAKYEPELEAAIAEAIDRIEKDIAGLRTVPDFMVDNHMEGELQVLVTHPRQQERAR